MKVFISHSSKDKKFVRMLKDCLEANDIDTWVDEDELELGDSLASKLEAALNNSSHFVLVLSSASVESDWVKLEMKKALTNQNTGLLQKIIPIKYRSCELPQELSDRIYHDLSNEVVLPTTDGSKVRFISDGFDLFFLRLVRAIKNSAKEISPKEKQEIIAALKSSSNQVEAHAKKVHRGIFKVIGYIPEALVRYQKLALDDKSKPFDGIRPILLPVSAKNIMKVKIGERMIVKQGSFESFGHFAGYRSDDLKIVLDKRTREEIKIINQSYYQIEINPQTNTITIVDKLDNGSDWKPFTGNTQYAMAA
jgi:hypothetical protein